jgi:hypothetical protein
VFGHGLLGDTQQIGAVVGALEVHRLTIAPPMSFDQARAERPAVDFSQVRATDAARLVDAP